ncbi:MAG TPA: SRPBCC domain-containing protein [Polyangiaceae bacterium]|nr:SRPBCC domain-containing protein [Polyangiaceae bacterium]
MDCSIRCEIAATPDCVWALLTDAERFPSWNSTVTSLKGDIALGQRLELRVPLDPKRTFRPRVTRFEKNREMEWSDGAAPMFKGVRRFVLTPKPDGTTAFEMTEVFSGVMLPLIKPSLPDFGPVFETYAADLKRAAERSV